MTDLRGMDFAHHAASSLLSQELQKAGYKITHVGSEEHEKDFGEEEDGRPCIAYFDCGVVLFEKDGNKLSLYQSRFSDSWRVEGMEPLADREKLNDAEFVAEVITGLGL